MEAQEELQKGEVKKASPELVQELMDSKRQKGENNLGDLVKASDFSRTIGVSFSSVQNLLNKLEEKDVITVSREDGFLYLDKRQMALVKDLFELKKTSTQKWTEILEDYPFEEY